jgi:uncharacterized protein YwgA
MPESEKTLILSRVLKTIGFDNVDMDNFDNRLIYQKLIYLIQNYGLSLGYGYSWYVKGPYSPELTKTLFTINPESFAESDNFRFQNDDVVIGKMHEIKTILNNKIQDPLFLEILASIVFIKKFLQTEISMEGLRSELLKRKPKLQDNNDFERDFSEAFRLMPKFVT